MCVDMRADMCQDVCLDMGVDMCADVCADMGIGMCWGMCVDMCVDMRTAMHAAMCVSDAWKPLRKRVHRHAVSTHVGGHVRAHSNTLVMATY